MAKNSEITFGFYVGEREITRLTEAERAAFAEHAAERMAAALQSNLKKEEFEKL